jgi:hypothetical protein
MEMTTRITITPREVQRDRELLTSVGREQGVSQNGLDSIAMRNISDTS